MAVWVRLVRTPHRLFTKGRRRTSDETALESWAEISPEERAVLLVGILDDPTAREDEKSDAAMDLEFFSGPLVESGLIRIIRAEDFTSVLAQECAGSLGGIWARTGRGQRPLQVRPHTLDGVELGSVRRQLVDGQP